MTPIPAQGLACPEATGTHVSLLILQKLGQAHSQGFSTRHRLPELNGTLWRVFESILKLNLKEGELYEARDFGFVH